jgi:hypothetical protein
MHKRIGPRMGAAAAAVGAVVCAVGMAGTGVAAAEPAPTFINVGGDEIRPLDPGVCPGTLRVDRELDRSRPGVLTIVFTPTGAFGTAACPTTATVSWMNGIAPFSHQVFQPVAGPTRIEVQAGVGLSLVTAGVMPHHAFAPTAYVWIAP